MTLRRAAAWALIVACVGCSDAASEPAPEDFELDLPVGFPAPRIPADNPISAEKIELGRYLFYDKRLSGNGTQACGSCHEQARAFTDGRATAEGSTGEIHPRNSQSLTNAVYNATLTWASPVLKDLEQQLLIPIFGDDPVELGATGAEEEILARIASDSLYEELFVAAFPRDADPVNWDNIVRALASFTRSLISGSSPFDLFVYGGDSEALSESAIRGMQLFYSELLECHHCHGGFNFTESSIHADSPFDSVFFHNTGLYNIDGNGAYPANNTGLFATTGNPQDMGRFRAPTLRNIGVTAPYMHDGSIETLEDVIRFYEAGGRVIEDGPYAGDGRASPLKSGFVTGFTLSDEEREDLTQFLESLTDTAFLSDPRSADPFSPEAQ